MSELKIGDRVKVVLPKFDEEALLGETGKVIAFKYDLIGVDFDNDIGGHDCCKRGRDNHCWWVCRTSLKKIEDAKENTEEETKEEAKEEIKVETIEQKILTVLREEIGVEIGEEFDVYENERKIWTCRFEENGHLTRCHENGKFRVTFIWKYWVFHFDKYVFKKRLSFPTKEDPYFYVQMRLDNNGKAIYDGVDYVYWYGKDFDIAMLITGNYFKTEEEAEANKEKVIERMNKLLKGE